MKAAVEKLKPPELYRRAGESTHSYKRYIPRGRKSFTRLNSRPGENKKNNMVKVLVLGATGYVGFPLCQSLLRANHKVYGLARTQAKAIQLARAEIVPVLGSFEDPGAYMGLIRDERIDVVVDSTSGSANAARTVEDLRALSSERIEAGRASGWAGTKLGYIYVSGMWVHGSSTYPVDDFSPIGCAHARASPPSVVEWRPAVERAVLASRDMLDAMIVRPAVIYGRDNPLWAFLFQPLLTAAMEKGTEAVNVQVDPEAIIPLVHVDDTVSGLHQAVERLPLISGANVWPVFDLMTSRESLRVVVQAAAWALGFHGKVECAGVGDDATAMAMSCSTKGDSSRARDLLGWQPKILGMADGIEKYVLSFRVGPFASVTA
jgi:nucleoside-diphosphate-sugar epimerase